MTSQDMSANDRGTDTLADTEPLHMHDDELILRSLQFNQHQTAITRRNATVFSVSAMLLFISIAVYLSIR